MPEYTPPFATGDAPLTLTVGATPVVGGRLVEISGNLLVIPAGAASTKAVGVAATDQPAGAKVQIWPLPGVVHETTAAGAIAAGDNLAPAAAGAVAAIAAGTFGQLVGVALAAAADTATCRYIGR